MHKPESVLQNEMHKILWGFEIQMDHLLSASQPDLVLINKKKRKEKRRTCHLVDFTISVDCRVKIKKKSKMTDK